MKKTYKAGDVISKDIPIATETTLGGVKAKPKTSDDTQEVHIDTDGKLFTKAGGGSSGGTTVVANNGEATTEDLATLKVGNINYKVIDETKVQEMINASIGQALLKEY